VGDTAPPLAWLASLVTSAMVGARALWSDDWEATVETFPPSTGRGPARPSEGSTTEGEGTSSGTAIVLRTYGNGVSYSTHDFSEILLIGVRRNA
jgi:hypothetical protein